VGILPISTILTMCSAGTIATCFAFFPEDEFGFLHDAFEGFVVEHWKGLSLERVARPIHRTCWWSRTGSGLPRNVHFAGDEISYIRALPFSSHVRSDFFDYLSQFHFASDVWALPEGTIWQHARACPVQSRP
jgi:nicotinic acid phosphoribosyltransferase